MFILQRYLQDKTAYGEAVVWSDIARSNGARVHAKVEARCDQSPSMLASTSPSVEFWRDVPGPFSKYLDDAIREHLPMLLDHALADFQRQTTSLGQRAADEMRTLIAEVEVTELPR